MELVADVPCDVFSYDLRAHTNISKTGTDYKGLKQHSFCNFGKFLSQRGLRIVDKSFALS